MLTVHFYNILMIFDVPYQPWVKGMPGKSYNYQKLVKDAWNIASFYGSQVDGINVGLARTLKKY